VSAPKKKFFVRGLSAAERKLVIAQLLSAAQRAQGRAAPRPEAMMRVEMLKRNGEAPRNWLARLDLAADTLKMTGYRGGGTIDPQDLWTIVEDPDADPELRAGAARVLVRSQQDARVRVETLVEAVRDEGDKRMLRIAVSNEAEAAGAELEAFEERQLRAAIR
jgi:hypothetical protein